MPHDIDRARLQQLQAQGAALVEVLPSEEYEAEHLPDAVNLPLDQLRADSASELLGPDIQRPIVVYCQAAD